MRELCRACDPVCIDCDPCVDCDPKCQQAEVDRLRAERDAALAKIRRANGVLDDLSLSLPALRARIRAALAGPEDRNERCPS